MIFGIQVLGIIFGLFMLYLSFLHYKRREFSRAQFLFWETLWLGFILIILFPKITAGLVQELGITRAMDFFMILGFMSIGFLTFYNYTAVNRMRRKLEDKVRKEALRDLENQL